MNRNSSKFFLLAQVAVGCVLCGLILMISDDLLLLTSIVKPGGGRFLQESHKNDHYKGDIVVDFYRTKKSRSFLGLIPYDEYSIPKWRLWVQLRDLNKWFDGRVYFKMGAIYETEDPILLNTPYFCEEGILSSFSNGAEIRNPDRISVLYVEQVSGTGHGCATYNILPGGNGTFAAPAMILGMSNTRPLWFSSTLGAAHWGGCSIAYHMGLIVGFLPTAAPEEGVAVYQDDTCGLNYRYPQFDWKINRVLDSEVVDPETGETYDGKDWRGRYNIMNPLEGSRDFFRIPTPHKIGLFKQKYGPIFDSILECWFTRAAARTSNNTQNLLLL